jgi:hypothetical protein
MSNFEDIAITNPVEMLAIVDDSGTELMRIARKVCRVKEFVCETNSFVAPDMKSYDEVLRASAIAHLEKVTGSQIQRDCVDIFREYGIPDAWDIVHNLYAPFRGLFLTWPELIEESDFVDRYSLCSEALLTYREASEIVRGRYCAQKATAILPSPSVAAKTLREQHGKRLTIDQRMKLVLFEKPESAGWTVTEFQAELKCSRGGVHKTASWQALVAARKLGKSEPRTDRRAKTRRSQVNKPRGE